MIKPLQPPCGRRKCIPSFGGTITRAYCRAIYEESVSRCFILPPEQGWQGNTIRKEAKRPENRVTRFPVEKVRRSRKGGGERSELITRMLIITYDTESQSRNADFISIAREGNPQPSGPKAPSNLRTLRTFGAKPRQPSHRRCVHSVPCSHILQKFIFSLVLVMNSAYNKK